MTIDLPDVQVPDRRGRGGGQASLMADRTYRPS